MVGLTTVFSLQEIFYGVLRGKRKQVKKVQVRITQNQMNLKDWPVKENNQYFK